MPRMLGREVSNIRYLDFGSHPGKPKRAESEMKLFCRTVSKISRNSVEAALMFSRNIEDEHTSVSDRVDLLQFCTYNC